MGLDAVELLVTVEEKFEIAITDEEAQQATTPRQLTDLVLSKIKVSTPRSCLSQKAFHLLRRNAIENLAVPRAGFRPETHLDEILSMAERRALWSEWKASVGASNWPELRRSKLLLSLLSVVVFAAVVYSWLLLREATSSSVLAFGGGTLAALGIGWLGAVITRPWRLEFPAGYTNVGELSQFLVARNPGLLENGTGGWTREQVWCTIRAFIIELTGTTDFNEDSDFSRDIFR